MDSQSLSSPITPPTPPRSDPGTPTILSRGETRRSRRKNLGWAPPTLQIPEPMGFSQPSPRLSSSQPISAGGHYTANISMHGMSPHPNSTSYMYGRKASRYMFNQFNDIKDFTIGTARSGLGIGEKCSFWCYNKLSKLSRNWFTHIFLSIVIITYTVGGALMFISIEGPQEEKVDVDLRNRRKELLELLRNMSVTIPHEKSVGEWNGAGYQKLVDYELDVIKSYEKYKLYMSGSTDKKWTFWNSVFYCSTIYTTIGYGHIYPVTTLGKGLTILYALIGIPLFLIILTDFGKLFTRCIKYVWAFFRRLCYTGRCRRVRKTTHVEEIFKGAQIVYDIAHLRRPSVFDPNVRVDDPEAGTGTPGTPAPSNFEIDDQFNLPISLALSLLVLYIILGAVAFNWLEGWDFSTSFYFVFISMSTVGFGDFVPARHTFMIFTIVYLVFGLALMSMCINVVQDKLSDTFKQASAKLGATLGVAVNDEDGSIATVPPEAVEMPELHNSETASIKAASANAI